MAVIEGRLWVRLIDHRSLTRYMEFRGLTVRQLAQDVDRETRKHGHPTKSRAIIGHLRSGKRNTCQPWTAAAIETCLNTPPGSLFVPTVSHVSRPNRTAA